MGGSNDKANLVSLTNREHFICHLLLTFMIADPVHRRSMTFAAHILACPVNGNDSKLNSRSYDIIRKQVRQSHLALWQDPEHRAKMSIARLKTWADPEFQEKMSQTHKELWQTEVHRETMRSRDEQMKLLWQDPAFREKQSASRSNSWTPERKAKHAAKISAINAEKRKAGIKGKPQTPAQRIAASQRWSEEDKQKAREKAIANQAKTPEEQVEYKEACRQRYLKSLG